MRLPVEYRCRYSQGSRLRSCTHRNECLEDRVGGVAWRNRRIENDSNGSMSRLLDNGLKRRSAFELAERRAHDVQPGHRVRVEGAVLEPIQVFSDTRDPRCFYLHRAVFRLDAEDDLRHVTGVVCHAAQLVFASQVLVRRVQYTSAHLSRGARTRECVESLGSVTGSDTPAG